MARAVIAVIVLVAEALAMDTASEAVCGEQYRTANNASTYFFFSNGTIRTSNGDSFHLGSYENVTDSTFERSVSMIKLCVIKCCPQGLMVMNWTCLEESNVTSPLSIPIKLGSRFFIDWEPNWTTDRNYIFKDNVVSPNPHHFFRFCENNTNYINDTDIPKTAVCFDKEQNVPTFRWLYITGMLVSVLFLLATFVVYAVLPGKNLYSKCLMCYVLTLLMAYLLLIVIQLNRPSANVCLFLGTFCYLFFMVSFFTMNIMAFDIWLTFSGIRSFSPNRKRGESRRFIYYNLYMWGVSALLVAVMLTLNKTANANAWYNPHMGDVKCWFNTHFSVMIYFYGIIAIIICVNILLFATTAWRIRKIQKDTKILDTSDDNRKHYEKDKRHFKLYLKLMLAMGLNWSTEIISWTIHWKVQNVPQEIWYITDLFNILYGVFIFFMFVFKKKILTQLRERIGSLNKKSKSHLKVSDTTTKQNTLQEETPNTSGGSESTNVTIIS